MKKSTKKTTAPEKNLSKNKKPAAPVKASSSLLGKLASKLKSVAKPMAMSPKSAAKKPQAKIAPKAPVKAAAPAPKAAPLKASAPVKSAPHRNTGKKTPPQKIHLKPATNAPLVAGKNLKNSSGKDAIAPKNITVEGSSAKGKTSTESTAKNAAKTTGSAALNAKPSTKPLTKPVKVAKKSATYEKSDQLCREATCENMATTKGFCRLDYIKNWKKIKRKEMILKEGKLNQYIEELVSKYPDKYIDVIRQDLTTEVNFNKVIHDLELDESIDDLDYDGDSIDSLIGSVRKDGEGFDTDDF